MYLEKRHHFLGVLKKIEISTFRRIFFKISFPSLPSRVCGPAAYIEIITHWFCFHAAVSVVPRLGELIFPLIKFVSGSGESCCFVYKNCLEEEVQYIYTQVNVLTRTFNVSGLRWLHSV